MKKINLLFISVSFIITSLFFSPLITKGQEIFIDEGVLKIAAFLTSNYNYDNNQSDDSQVEISTTSIADNNTEDVVASTTTEVEVSQPQTQESSDEVRPCTREYFPVCGLNGVTYSNKCVAGDNPLLHFGACNVIERPAEKLNVNGEILERIISPDQIKNFKVMKNENGVLYGTRLELQNKETKKQEKKLEKIPSPQYINQYQNIQRISNALWGIKKDLIVEDIKTSSQNKRVSVISANMSSCVALVIDKKDEALKDRITKNNDNLKVLISTRNSCQKQALQTELNQKLLLDLCIRDFQNANKEMINKNKEEQNKIWQNYRNELKSCLPEKDILAGTEILIEDGGSGFLEMTLN